MIFIDRLMRFFKKDIYLPKRCNASFMKKINPCERCTCKSFCRKLPDKATLSPIIIDIKNKRI